MISVKHWLNDSEGGNRSSRRKIRSAATFFTSVPTWNHLGLNVGLRCVLVTSAMEFREIVYIISIFVSTVPSGLKQGHEANRSLNNESCSFVNLGTYNFVRPMFVPVFLHSYVAVSKTSLVVICVHAMQRKGTGDDNPHSELMFE